MIRTHQLTKIYRVPLKDPGLWNSVRSLFDRKYREVRAVDAVELSPGHCLYRLSSSVATGSVRKRINAALKMSGASRCGLWPTFGKRTSSAF